MLIRIFVLQQRETNDKGSTEPTTIALRRNTPAVRFHDDLRDGQPDPKPTISLCTRTA